MDNIGQLLEDISSDILQRFQKTHKFKHFHIMNPMDNILAVYIMFRRKKDLERFKKNTDKIQSSLMDFLNVQLEAMGKQIEFDVQIEMDSEEEQKEMAEKRKNRMPSKKDFERADAADAFRNRGLREVHDQTLNRFKNDKLYEIFLFYSPAIDTFGVYVFYEFERHIKEAEESGLASRIQDAVIEELEKVGRGKRGELKVNFEFDSNENVEKNYEGDYYLRLR